MKINDAHCHFFSPRFFQVLHAQRQPPGEGEPLAEMRKILEWEIDSSSESLARRWAEEISRHGVNRLALMASIPEDEDSVAEAVALFPNRVVGYFMVDPSSPNLEQRVRRALEEHRLRCVCLFPAMHGFSLKDERLRPVLEALTDQPGRALFVHCGVLSVGIRKKLGLPSPFDLSLSNPLDVHWIAARYPQLPVIIPHFGAGMFREALMAADLCPNIYLDTSSSNGWISYHPGLTLKEVFAAALRIAGAQRLLFGTDSSFFPRGWQKQILASQRGILEDLGLSEEEKSGILAGNFDRIFPP